jgi:hypothetical protein
MTTAINHNTSRSEWVALGELVRRHGKIRQAHAGAALSEGLDALALIHIARCSQSYWTLTNDGAGIIRQVLGTDSDGAANLRITENVAAYRSRAAPRKALTGLVFPCFGRALGRSVGRRGDPQMT